MKLISVVPAWNSEVQNRAGTVLPSFCASFGAKFTRLILIVSVGCANVAAHAEAQKWYVYHNYHASENHGIWSNIMPANGADMLNLNMSEPSKNEPTPFNTTAIRISVHLKSPWWCGLVVSSRDQYWGEDREPAFDHQLETARKLVFWARGEKGGETIQVKLGITGGKPYGDSTPFPFATEWLQLDSKWQEYDLDVDGQALSRVVTPFVVVVDHAHNPTDEATFYLGEIYFQM